MAKRDEKGAARGATAKGLVRAGKQAAGAIEGKRSVSSKGATERALSGLRGHQAIAVIARRVQTIAESFYDIALELLVLQRREIYTALGASSFAEVVEKHTSLSRALAFELVKIPAHLTREAAVALGREKAVALIRYVDATPAPDDSAQRLAQDDGKVGSARVSSATAKDIEREAGRARREAAPASREGEEGAHAVAQKLESQLEQISGAGATVAPFRRGDAWWLRIEVPAEAAGQMKVGSAGKKPAKTTKAASTKKAASSSSTKARKKPRARS